MILLFLLKINWLIGLRYINCLFIIYFGRSTSIKTIIILQLENLIDKLDYNVFYRL